MFLSGKLFSEGKIESHKLAHGYAEIQSFSTPCYVLVAPVIQPEVSFWHHVGAI